MRNFRKTLALALILALALGSFSMVSGATASAPALNDIAGLPGEGQITVCQNLGIIEGFPDGTYRPNDMVNRAQFAALVTRALGTPDSALASYTTTTFTDTAGYGWAVPYLSFCEAKGIMVGYGDGTARPGNTITVNEAMTMILRAIGYTEKSSELVGSWPANYVSIARANNLYDGLSGSTVNMDRQDVAIALYNALTAQLVYVDAEGRTVKQWTNDEWIDENGVSQKIASCMANAGLGCTVFETLVTPDFYGNSLISVADRLGASGLAFENKSGVLVAFKADTTFLTGKLNGGKFDASDGVSYVFGESNLTSDGVTLYWNGGVDKKAEHGRILPGKPADVVKAFTERINGDPLTDGYYVTLAVKTSGATIKKIYSMLGWAASKTSLISAGEISAIASNDTLLGGELKLDDNQDIDYNQLQLAGTDSLDNIQSDNVVYIYTDSGNVIRKAAVGQGAVNGAIDEVAPDNFTISGKSYEYAANYLADRAGDATNPGDIKDEAGSSVSVKLDAYGYAYDITLTASEIGSFGLYMAGVYDTSGNGSVSGDSIRLFTSEDDKTFNVVKGSKLDWYKAREYYKITNNFNKRGAAVKFANAVPAFDYSTGKSFVAADLFGYQLDGNGAVIALEQGYKANVTFKSGAVLTTSEGDVIIDKDCVVFGVDGDNYNLAKVGSIDLTYAKSHPNTSAQYILSAKGDAVVALAIDQAFLQAGSGDSYAVVNSTSGLPGNAVRFAGYVDGTSGSLDTIADGPTVSDFSKVTLYMMTSDADGKVKSARDIGTTDYQGRNILTEMGFDGIYGVKVGAGSPGNVSYSYIDIADGSKLLVEDSVIVYQAEYRNGKVFYSSASKGGLGISSIKGDAYIWAYSTKKASEVSDVADVVIWMTSDDWGKFDSAVWI